MSLKTLRLLVSMLRRTLKSYRVSMLARAGSARIAFPPDATRLANSSAKRQAEQLVAVIHLDKGQSVRKIAKTG